MGVRGKGIEGSAESKGWSVDRWLGSQDEADKPQSPSHSWRSVFGGLRGRRGLVRTRLVAAQEWLAVG